MHSFRYSSLAITAPKRLCPDDVIFMLVLLNTFTAFDSYSGLIIKIVLFGFHSKGSSTNYAVSIISMCWSNHQQRLPFLGLFQNGKSLGVSEVVLMLFHTLLSQLDLTVWCLHEIQALYHRVKIVLLEHCNSCAQK